MSSVHPRRRCISLLQKLNPKTLIQTKQIHAQLIINGLKSQSFIGTLIGHYCSSSSSSFSSESNKLAHLLVFPRFDRPDTFLFNTLLKCSKPMHSIRIFADSASENCSLFDEYTFVFVLGACARSGSVSTLWFGREIHGMVMKLGFLPDYVLLGTTAIHVYAKNGDLPSARKMFDEMPERNSITWNAMIAGYCSSKEKGKGYAGEALTLFREILRSDDVAIRTTATTMVCILSAISQTGLFEIGALIHGYIEKSGFLPSNDVFIGSGLVDMYLKCGCLKGASSVFKLMESKNVVTWTSMATGLALHGEANKALHLLYEMADSGIKPNEATFTGLLLACCHKGLVEEGLNLFQNMEKTFDIVPNIQHYGCIVDLLGRAGRIREAFAFISAMPIKRDAILWRSLLNACRVHGDAVMGEKVGKILHGLDQEKKHLGLCDECECEDLVALSNVFAAKGEWREVEKVRHEMKERKIKTRYACSLV